MNTDSQREKLKSLFAKRVTTQARLVLDIYQKWKLQDLQDEERGTNLLQATQKLEKYAKRFEMPIQEGLARRISNLLDEGSGYQHPLSQEARSQLEDCIQQLKDNSLRKSDKDDNEAGPADESMQRTFLRTPVYLTLSNHDQANRIINQLEFFGFRAINYASSEALIHACQQNKPETIVIDVDFEGVENRGFETIEAIQANHETPIPIIYLSQSRGDISTRLQASRTGGEEFFYKTADPGQLIEKIEQYTHANPQSPYRVLIVDDSKSQARFIENILSKSGMVPRVINEPMEILIAMEEFKPEIIIMDMYMPNCTGMELARVIRQQDRFHSIPIIYLSAEDDINKQLHAMSLGGDDFLTKPINPKHLTATIHNRGRRARSLLALMVRDSLTGLFNHTHTLHLLASELANAERKQQPITFAMLDIDYFKKINDSYGHPIGDRVLKSLSMFLKQRLRKSDHIGRYGGEEFAIILPNTGERDAKVILNEIREKFTELQHPIGDNSFNVSFSCGIASCTHEAIESSQTICEKADKALYEAKRAGRNCVRCFRQ